MSRDPEIIDTQATVRGVPEKPSVELDRFVPNQSLLMHPIDTEDDPLGIYRHEHPMRRISLGIFTQFDALAAQRIRANADARESYVEQKVAVLGAYDPDIFRNYRISRGETDSGDIYYHVSRTDGSDGGFAIQKCATGAVLYRRDHKTIEEDDAEYAQSLMHAQEFVKGLAEGWNSHLVEPSVPELMPTEGDFRSEIFKMYKQENSRLQQAKRAAIRAGQVAANKTVVPLFTVEEKISAATPGAGDTIRGKRRLSRARVAIAALLMPLPFVSDAVYEPASMDIATGAVSFAWDETFGSDDIINSVDDEALLAYDAKKIDLRSDANLTSSPAPIEVQKPAGAVADGAPRLSWRTSDTEESVAYLDLLGGQSPRILEASGALLKSDCKVIPVSPAVRNSSLAIAATSRASAEHLTARQIADGIELCNASDVALNLKALEFQVDVVSKGQAGE